LIFLKKNLKRFIAAVVSTIVACSVFTAPVSAAWIKSGEKWWYQNPDGSYPKSCWSNLSGQWYLFDQDGWMLTGWQQSGGYWYYLSEAHDGSFGAMQVGWVQSAGRWYYMDPATGGPQGAMVTGWRLVSGQWYYLYPQVDGPQGACAINTTTPDGYQVGPTGAWIR
jgi:glucan-binding YG repeat protein